MVQDADGKHGGANGGAASASKNEEQTESTQNTQYDQIGSRYLDIKLLPAAEPEVPSILAALGEGGVRGFKCLDLACGTGKYTHLLATLGATSVTGHDISPTMIASALTTYPPTQYPTLHFSVQDCSIPSSLPPPTHTYDLVFSAWLLNYAGSESELTNMFRVAERQMVQGARFVALTTNAHDPLMATPKRAFYGLDVLVLDPAYVAPDTREVVGIQARVQVGGGTERGGFEFDVFQFRKEVYERCAGRAGLEVAWREAVVPDDERKGVGYWDEWVTRPTFAMLEARRVGEGEAGDG
ncbi:uncharacterized protein EKO05_0002678 [Ascochyta rabiei]|uniref:Uncharacterized protein n=1 Tax=Didymella rabiei TaxID=5454 RepID=A0A163GNC4_DIDRA|nr:uncharacterized protein EKO05_0002678 [Ascochyta rabiei]KZM24934.1 hypothetical protein ST47_g3928 [Ascochyta rabiei]UPX12107.1 hypothetical protein EKO05_0002678 [Ascochyta rabiei]